MFLCMRDALNAPSDCLCLSSDDAPCVRRLPWASCRCCRKCTTASTESGNTVNNRCHVLHSIPKTYLTMYIWCVQDHGHAERVVRLLYSNWGISPGNCEKVKLNFVTLISLTNVLLPCHRDVLLYSGLVESAYRFRYTAVIPSVLAALRESGHL